MLDNKCSYVLITPARNEEAYIEKTIQSVITQTVLPKKWVIVSDGSSDCTDAIVKQYAKYNSWIELIRIPNYGDRTFAAKVHCFDTGYEKVKDIKYDVIGNLDADISFQEDYFEFLLSKFAENSKLGVAGTPFVEGNSHYDYNFTNIEHVSGACQLFRRECFQQIGGYVPIKGGGIDWVAVSTARMKGWETRTFVEKTCFHNRKIGTGNNSILMAKFRLGQKDFYLGGHPLWEIFRALYQTKEKPFILGGLFIFFGYFMAFVKNVDKPIAQELMLFHRKEQMKRLKKIILNAFKF